MKRNEPRSYDYYAKKELRPYMIRLWVFAILGTCLLLYGISLDVSPATICFALSISSFIASAIVFKQIEKKGYNFSSRNWEEFLGDKLHKP